MLQKKYSELLHDYYNGRINKKQYLDALNNLFGGLQVQVHGKKMCTKWMPWLDVREQEWWIKNINHRSILWPEAVFDIDLPKWLNKKERELVLAMTLKRLHALTIDPEVIDTGKGYHLHYFCNEMVMSISQHSQRNYGRRQIIQTIISDIRTDLCKVSEKSMIALEKEPHWKRGNIIKLWSKKSKMGLMTAYEKIIGENKEQNGTKQN